MKQSPAILLPAAVFCGWLALCLAAAPEALAGNRQSYLIGGRGAMMGGAFSAVADDASAAWYNPGGLAFNSRSSIDISANAFALTHLRIRDFASIRSEFEEISADFGSLDYAVVPTSFVYVLRLTKKEAPHPIAMAFSVFVPTLERWGDSMKVETALQYPEQNLDLLVRERMDFSTDQQTYFIGPALGFHVNDSLGLGLSVHAVYAKVAMMADYYADVVERNSAVESFSLATSAVKASHVGIGFSVGLLAKIGDRMNLGLSFRSPVFKIYSDVEGTSFEAGVSDEVTFEDTSSSHEGFGTDMVFPWSVTAAVAFLQEGRWIVDFELDYTGALDNARAGIHYKGVVNARGGVEIGLTPKVFLGFGLFTDASPFSRLRSLHDRQIDFVGGTMGVTWRTAYAVSGSKKTSRIDFSTTVGVRYAHGWGKVVGLTQDVGAESQTFLTVSEASIEEAAVYIGSSASF